MIPLEQLKKLAATYTETSETSSKQRTEETFMSLVDQLPPPILLLSLTTIRATRLFLYLLDLPMMVRLLFRKSPPGLLEIANVNQVPGWYGDKAAFLRTKIKSSNGKVFDVSSQFEHSFVLLNEEQVIAGIQMANFDEASSYSRATILNPAFQRQNLGTFLFWVQAKHAKHLGMNIMLGKGHKDRIATVRLFTRLGYEMGLPDETDHYLATASPSVVVDQAIRYLDGIQLMHTETPWLGGSHEHLNNFSPSR